MEWDLLEKTTLWIEDVQLNEADLALVAAEVAATLGLESREVMVVDVRPGLVAFDILRRQIRAEAVAGRGSELLRRLAEVPGVRLGEGAQVHSEGILGLIAVEPELAKDVLRSSVELTQKITETVGRRALVFASGSEVLSGKIQDTNSPYIIGALKKTGYKAEFGGVLADDLDASVSSLEGSVERGFGLIITTGGVGAEDKDVTVEAVLRLDPAAHTPWILKFSPDGRWHHKRGVRIAVGQIGITKLVALPGPHEEAKLGLERLLEGLSMGLDKLSLAEHIAAGLRKRWRSFMRGGEETRWTHSK